MSKENTLFVEEDVPMDVEDDSATETNVESDQNRDEEKQIEILDDEDSDDDEEQEDDPIVESVPIHLGKVPERVKQSLHLLQYQGKPNTTKDLPHMAAAVKPESGFIQVKLPLNTTKFYDESKTQEWGVEVAEHNHVGVLNKTNGGLYAAKFVRELGEKKMVLVPIDSTTQLRPSFKYLDDIESVRSKKEMPEHPTRSSSHNVHILQSNAKNNKNTTTDPLATTALGESLKHVRRFDQEPWNELQWTDQDTADSTTLHDKITSITTTELGTQQSLSEYLQKLTT